MPLLFPQVGPFWRVTLTGSSDVVLSSQSEVSPQIFVFINMAMALAPPVLLPLTSSGHLDSFAL